jgi:hypothetical protein
MSKKITEFEEGFVLIQDENLEASALSCPVCDYFIDNDQHAQYYSQYNCCFDCAVKWAEGLNKDKWKKGWRPSTEEIEEEKIFRRKMITPLRFD